MAAVTSVGIALEDTLGVGNSAAEQFIVRSAREAVMVEGYDEGHQELQASAEGLGDADWMAVYWLARRHGLCPLVFHHIGRAGLMGRLPDEVVGLLRADYCESFIRNRRLQVETAAVLGALRQRGVEVILLKGVCLAARCYDGIALRPVNDIDLLVRRSQLAECLAALRAAGYSRTAPGTASEFRFLNSFELSLFGPAGIHVEPHLEMARSPGYRAGMAVDKVWTRAACTKMLDESALYLGLFDELRYLSTHFVVGHKARRWLWLVDIAILAGRLQDHDWLRFVEETIRFGLATPTALALTLAHEHLGARVPAAQLERLLAATTSHQERFNWRLAHAANSNLLRLAWHTWSLSDGVERATYLLGASGEGMRQARQSLARAWKGRQITH